MAPQGQAAATNTNETAYLLKPPRHQGPYSPRILLRKKRTLLKAFGQTLSITEAAKAAGVERGTHYLWLENDPQYAQEFADLEERKVEFLEQQTYKRGAVGWEEPVFHAGKECGKIRRFSDACAIFMLKAARPEKYRERFQVDANVTGTLLVPAAAIDLVMGRALELRRAGAIEAAVVEENTAQQESTPPPSDNE